MDSNHIDWTLVLCCTHQGTTGQHPGGDYVNHKLGIILRHAPDSVLAFHPSQLHATTHCDHVSSTGIVFSFSSNIVEAFQASSQRDGYVPRPAFMWQSIGNDDEEGLDDEGYADSEPTVDLSLNHGNCK